MIRFEFELEDVDAQNLFDCINSCIARSSERAMQAIVDGQPEQVEAYNRDMDYLQSLKAKMTNTRVQS